MNDNLGKILVCAGLSLCLDSHLEAFDYYEEEDHSCSSGVLVDVVPDVVESANACCNNGGCTCNGACR